ncbi:MAG: beta-hydroxyacyl-ACP dehydratase [Paraburkholderia sp.]|uniref:AMP-binding protein n=1 Tax=Paraburkholderia sp. TaxID=1926495 RepID=UPI001212B092|nr:AMP-binding protein [Paraburkholderia sp.]TAM07805.1 MAG: beta-hydroxyacyl-ACP dehydratase [Paraburkholderia sp.]TAM31524.1 MAG: beta-hydroxyacyl-ACP dehydratase [Paraburkholderia sp.]
MSSYPLLFHPAPGRTIAWRDGAPVSVRTFLADVARLAAALPPGGHVFNVCVDRYRFAVGLCAALVAGRISLLPSTQTPEMVRQLATFAPDTFCLHDAADCTIDLPRFRFPEPGASDAHDDIAVPQIDAAQVVAYVFTSGSTGTPVPHRKTWGLLVRCVRAAAERLGLATGPDAGKHTLIGTVPAQHMYGFESTVLLALIGGLAFSNRQPFYPADVRAELEAVPAPRVLVTTPVHLRALLAADRALPGASLVLSATAPLPPTLAREAEARLAAPLIEIYGSTETGQIATRRTAQGDPWHLLAGVRLDTSPQAHGDGQDDSASDEVGNEACNDGGPCAWASGGHIEEPVPMGDAIELLDDSHFLLHGRKTDLVNIAGKRTSLAYLNYQLNAIPGVEDGVFYMPDEAPSQAGAAADAAAKSGDHAGNCADIPACGGPVARLAALVVAPQLSAADLLHALRERIDAAFMPRPLRFVDALPRNATGKLPRNVLAMLVAQRPNEAQPETAPPQRHAACNTAHTAPLTFTIPAGHPALPGHFPGQPIVPGVVLLDHALMAIGAALNRSFDRCRINSAKFLSPAAPDETLDVGFESTASGAIRFTVSAGQREVASGVLSAPNAPDAPNVPDATQAHGAARA